MTNRVTIRHLLRDLLPLVFLRRKKGEKNHYFIQFSLRTMIWVTVAILDAAWIRYNGDIFHNHNKKLKYCPKLNERQRLQVWRINKAVSQNSTRRYVTFSFSIRTFPRFMHKSPLTKCPFQILIFTLTQNLIWILAVTKPTLNLALLHNKPRLNLLYKALEGSSKWQRLCYLSKSFFQTTVNIGFSRGFKCLINYTY